jgi:proteasome lid subunit RPN8/RPN11
MMELFGCALTQSILDAVAEHGERDYPREACGLVLGPAEGPELVRVVPLANVQDRYHERDPERFPRDARQAFRVDELERMRVLEAAEAEGLVERALYHSHPDAGAYFSPEDRAAAVHDGEPLMPGVVQMVVSVREGRRSELAAYLWSSAERRFQERRIPLRLTAPFAGLPDLETRRMTGGEAARPIEPVGSGLAPRRLTSVESERVRSLAERRLPIDAASALAVQRLGLGLLSPLTGFLRAGELASIGATGRLLSGADWRSPLTLRVPSKQAQGLAIGALVELVDPEDRSLAVMGVSEVHAERGGHVQLGGPVYVYAEVLPRPDAVEIRAELLRRGARRVLAAPGVSLDGLAGAELDDFDVVLAPPGGAGLAPGRVLEVPLLEGVGGWQLAAMAQNAGATHVWLPDASEARTVRDTLAIVPWPPHRAP